MTSMCSAVTYMKGHSDWDFSREFQAGVYLWRLQNYANHNNYYFTGFPETTPAPFTGNRKREENPHKGPTEPGSAVEPGPRLRALDLPPSPLTRLQTHSRSYLLHSLLPSVPLSLLGCCLGGSTLVSGLCGCHHHSQARGAMPEEAAWGSSQWLAGPFAYELPPHFLIIEESTVDLLHNEHVSV